MSMISICNQNVSKKWQKFDTLFVHSTMSEITGGGMTDKFAAIEESDYALKRMLTFLEKDTIYIYMVGE